MSLKIGSLYWITEVEHLQPVRDRVTKLMRAPKRKPRILSRRLVIVTDGQYMSNGRLSNFWHWKYFDATTLLLTKEEGHGYPNGVPYLFEPAPEFETTIQAVRKRVRASRTKPE